MLVSKYTFNKMYAKGNLKYIMKLRIEIRDIVYNIHIIFNIFNIILLIIITVLKHLC